MAFQPAPDIIKVAIEGLLDGEECVNTLHFTGADSFSQDDYKAFAQAIGLYWITNAIPMLCSTYQLVKVTATDMSVQDGYKGEWIPALPQYGTILAPQAPNNVSLAIGYSSGRVGRSTRGRSYWPVIPKDQLAENEINGAYVSDALEVMVGFIGPSTRWPGTQFCVCSREINKTKRPVAIPYLITTAAVEDNVVDSQRRRLPKRGQ